MINKIDKNKERQRRHARVRKKVNGVRKVSGTAETPRMEKEVKAQIKDMTKTEAAKAVGKKAGEKALAKGIKSAVFDRGGYLYTGRVQAVADGAREAGLNF